MPFLPPSQQRQSTEGKRPQRLDTAIIIVQVSNLRVDRVELISYGHARQPLSASIQFSSVQ